MAEQASDHVEIEKEGRVGRIILERPHARNALTLEMVSTIKAVLDAWRHENLRAVTIESGTPGVFCAGGDIRKVRTQALAGRALANEMFFRTEYELNLELSCFPAPVVSLIDGVCMGGGLGLSVHGPFRVVTPRASFAMPETKIGFFPDVGASYFLPRLPGAVGKYLGLTGARFSAADAFEIGIATHWCPTERISDIPDLISSSDGPIEAALQSLGEEHTPTDLPGDSNEINERRTEIDWAFGAPTVAAITNRLDQLVNVPEPAISSWASSTSDQLLSASPQSLALTLALLSQGRQRSLARCLYAELRLAKRVVATPDFSEGVRAVLVDKDFMPVWGSWDDAWLTDDEFVPGTSAVEWGEEERARATSSVGAR